MYVRGTDGAPAVRLGDGESPTLSPDGKWILSRGHAGQHALLELPTGAGESRSIPTGDVQPHIAYFFPDGKHILELGNQAGHGLRLWVQDVAGNTPRPISPEGASVSYRSCISPDGQSVAATDPDGKITIYPVSDGKPTLVPGVQPGESPIQWTPDGRSLLVGAWEVPNHIFLVNLTTGKRTLFKTFSPADPTGLFDSAPPNFSRNLKTYVGSYTRITSDLYIVDGLK